MFTLHIWSWLLCLHTIFGPDYYVMFTHQIRSWLLCLHIVFGPDYYVYTPYLVLITMFTHHIWSWLLCLLTIFGPDYYVYTPYLVLITMFSHHILVLITMPPRNAADCTVQKTYIWVQFQVFCPDNESEAPWYGRSGPIYRLPRSWSICRTRCELFRGKNNDQAKQQQFRFAWLGHTKPETAGGGRLVHVYLLGEWIACVYRYLKTSVFGADGIRYPGVWVYPCFESLFCDKCEWILT